MPGRIGAPVPLGIALTAPYFHDGRFATLEQLLEVYEHSVREVLVAALCSPSFLFLVEPPAAGEEQPMVGEDVLAEGFVVFLHAGSEKCWSRKRRMWAMALRLSGRKPKA